MSASVHRYDFAPITRCETTDEGYLRVWCRAARTGTQLYMRSDGSQVREYRPEDEVAKPESLSTFGMKPATWGHPPALLDSENTKQHQIGYSGSQVRFSDGFVEVALVVTDKDAIDKIKRKDATEVSAGYKVDYDPTPGITPEGESYDGVQRNIRVNHIAIVPRGRAGPEVRLLMDRMDSADAVALDSSDPALHSSNTASPVMAKVRLDGLEIELPAEAATAVQSFARDMERQLKAVTSERDELSNKLDSIGEEIETLAYEKETAETRVEELTARVDSLEKSASDSGSESRIDAAELDKLLTERLNVLRHLAPAFEDDYKFDGIDSDTLYAQAFTNLTGEEAPEGASPAYLTGVVDGILAARADASPEDEDEEEEEGEEEEDRIDYAQEFKETINKGSKNAQRSDAVSSYRAKQVEAWKRPLTAHK